MTATVMSAGTIATAFHSGLSRTAGKEGNWLATVPGKGYLAIIRLYGPTDASINKSWKPGDIELMK